MSNKIRGFRLKNIFKQNFSPMSKDNPNTGIYIPVDVFNTGIYIFFLNLNKQ